MWKILISAGGFLLSWATKLGASKLVVFGLVIAAANWLIVAMLELLPSWFSATSLSQSFNFMPSSAWYFFDYAQGGAAISLFISALVARFLIRRIPFFG